MKKITILVRAFASLLGCGRGKTMVLANAKAGCDYKAMHAEAIGISPTATDDEAVAAHHKHMAMANDMAEAMGDGSNYPAAMDNAKKDEATSLINGAVSEGRVTEADRAAWEGKFGDDFDGARAALAAVKKPSGEAPEIANAKRQADAFRREATELLLGNAIAAGKITPAQRGEWEAKFAADFEGAKTALANAQRVIKTTAQTTRLGERQNVIDDAALSNEKARQLKVSELVNAKQKLGGLYADYNVAFNAVMSENPNLFEAMQKPEAKK